MPWFRAEITKNVVLNFQAFPIWLDDGNLRAVALANHLSGERIGRGSGRIMLHVAIKIPL